jgi:hypothetical protein
LHAADYPRKPKGARSLPEAYRFRLSFCCDREGCRKRQTPPSVRFLGRKVYLGVVVILVTAMRQGATPRRVRELSQAFGADRRTLARWRKFWTELFPRTKFWHTERARLVPVVKIVALPLSLVDAFVHTAKTWIHPVQGREVRFAARTIESWYYKARRERDDPVRVLRRAVRKDAGKVTLAPRLIAPLRTQYHNFPHWSYQLHYDNLAAMVKSDPSLGPLASYSTVRRYMQAHGLVRKRRERPKLRPGELRAAERREAREIRSYEAEYVGSLWHLDFHHGSLKVLTATGQWQRPLVLCVLDDHSRVCCHAQWYLSETAEDLVHGFAQAVQKRGLPRALMTDNGSAMLADEFQDGLSRSRIWLPRASSPCSWSTKRRRWRRKC